MSRGSRLLRLDAQLAFLGLSRYDPDQPRDDNGRFGEGGAKQGRRPADPAGDRW